MNKSTNRLKEAAKLFAGLAVHESLLHGSFGLIGKFPIQIGPVIITKELNTFGMIGWPIIAALLIYYAWFKK